ncbi:hypothetical protein Cgig2_026278 [Carnegiea gigantea]|uniref:Uncharacterized protein n=1 Tax=Carnegiea gigantea TaxID=171969 RepID=A0A9Q1JQW2_9CARY|nr:hypothetical protein Cgig2_026278 [Carnegiea gigantea]
MQKWSTNGKRARGKQLPTHTSGSQSFAVKRDNFDKEGFYHEPATKKFVSMSLINTYVNNIMINVDIAIDIVKRKTGASELVFSEAIVLIETFAYHKLMAPESSGRSDDVEENRRNNTPLVGEPIRDSLTAMPTLAKNNEVYIKDASQIENTTVLRYKGGAAHTSRSPHVLNQSYDQNTSMGENMNTSGCSNQSNIAQRLNFDQRERLKCIQGVSKGDRLTSTPSPLSRELMCSKRPPWPVFVLEPQRFHGSHGRLLRRRTPPLATTTTQMMVQPPLVAFKNSIPGSTTNRNNPKSTPVRRLDAEVSIDAIHSPNAPSL